MRRRPGTVLNPQVSKQINIGLIGGGTVGGGVWKNLALKQKEISSRTGIDYTIRRVAVRDLSRTREIPKEVLTGDWRAVVNDPEIQIVVELMGGTTTAFEVVKAALEAGKGVVTANKALLAERGEVLAKLADSKGLPLFFEASVAGGIPIIKALREGMRANSIRSIHGIINGTCNYILTRMSEQGEAFDDVLADAKKMGYAEADDSLDVDGIDAAHKAAVLASLAYGFWITTQHVSVEGIRHVSSLDVKMARTLGYTIKLLACIRQHPDEAVEVGVHPTLIPTRHILASVSGVYNAVAVEGDIVGRTLFYGRGAGADPTSSAVLSDILDAGCVLQHKHKPFCASGHNIYGKLLTPDEIISRRYVRLTVSDSPGVLAQIAKVFGDHTIGIAGVFQPEQEQNGTVPLILLLDRAKASIFSEALAQVATLGVVKAPPAVLRIEDLE